MNRDLWKQLYDRVVTSERALDQLLDNFHQEPPSIARYAEVNRVAAETSIRLYDLFEVLKSHGASGDTSACPGCIQSDARTTPCRCLDRLFNPYGTHYDDDSHVSELYLCTVCGIPGIQRSITLRNDVATFIIWEKSNTL